MSFKIALNQLSKIIEADVVNLSTETEKQIVLGIATDSRNIEKGELFLALQGKNFDGHNFLEMAVEKGAIALITSRESSVNSPKDIPQLRVKNTLETYQQIARWWRSQFSIPIIAITGSVGKTTTKELIAAVLSTQGEVLKTEANYNNEIGVPKTLLKLHSEHKYAVIEMAMRASGEIALLTKIACPTIGVITNVGTAHIGRLGSEAAIARAKCELLAEMPNSGVAILNHDNRRLMKVAATVWQGETVTYGLEGGDLWGELIDSQTLRVEGLDLPLPMPGRHNASNYLAALAVAKVVNVDYTPLAKGLSVNLPQGRSRRYQLPNDVMLLDETYNASLESTIAALQLLVEIPGKRHLAVLGTMKELGSRSAQLHRQVGETVKQLGVDLLFILVDEAETEEMAVGAAGVASECFSSGEQLVKRLQELVKPGDRILFKASNSVGLDRVVEKFRTGF
ncbi:MAG: UDP-N-acetylmuramoyl-tripeptide--D-alanyl-D-alanine ligase [Prochloraceae cyanobacterium]